MVNPLEEIKVRAIYCMIPCRATAADFDFGLIVKAARDIANARNAEEVLELQRAATALWEPEPFEVAALKFMKFAGITHYPLVSGGKATP